MDSTITFEGQPAPTEESNQADKGQRSFKSPRRVLVRSFLHSRDRWKAKYMAQKPKLKQLRNRAADAQRARDQWRERAQMAEADASQARAELAAAQAQLAELTAAEKKKR
jgi:hypothetical protein